MARTRVQEYLDLYVFTPGRRAWAARGMLAEADKAGLGDLGARAQAVIDGDIKLVADFQRWNVTKADAEGREVSGSLVRIDQRRDRSTGGLLRELQNKSELDDKTIADAAVQLIRRVFPNGAEAIVNAPFVEETMLLETSLGLLEGELAPLVAAAGVGSWVGQIRAQNNEFAALYATLNNDRAGIWTELKQRDKAGQEALAVLVVHALVESERMPHLRVGLMAAVEQQQDELRELYRRRGGSAIPDVDPTSGATEAPIDAPTGG